MKRRNFIQLSGFAAVAISLPFFKACSPPTNEQALSEPIFLLRLLDEQTIREAGKAYLQRTPSENSEAKLLQLLAGNTAIAQSKDEKAIHQYLNERIKHDFETGTTVLVKGWVLSLNEARQCALFSLIA